VNRQIRRLGVALLVCYLALFVQLNILQLGRAQSYADSPLNDRKIVRDFANPRGRIISADGTVVAESVDSDDRFRYLRTYPTADLFAPVTGYYSFTYGSDGVEKTYNDELAGQTSRQRVQGFADLFVDKIRTGDVVLSIRDDVQQAAKEALGEREGSVVALDPRTGAVLALWSYPSYDPNTISTHDEDAALAARKQLLADPAKPLLVNAYRERYFPGSTFKLVTSSTGVESGQVTPTSPVFDVLRSWVPPLTTRPLRNFGGEACGGALFEILAVSCNTAFAQMGVQLGAATMVRGAQAFGFDDTPPLDLPRPAPSRFPDVAFFDQNTPLLAQAAIGQNEVQATPLQMALVGAGIANGGQIMQPYVVDRVLDDTGEPLSVAHPSLWHQAVSPTTAATIRDAMVGVVDHGTATGLRISGVTVAGKTGTAQLGTDPPSSHAWIVGFAPAEAPRVVVAVILKGQPGVSEVTGGRLAAPVAKAVLQAALAAPDPLAGQQVGTSLPPVGASTPPSTTPSETSLPEGDPNVTIVPPTTAPSASVPPPDAPPTEEPEPTTTTAATTTTTTAAATTAPATAPPKTTPSSAATSASAGTSPGASGSATTSSVG
jgi:peptidoglycan glycosyltransferase